MVTFRSASTPPRAEMLQRFVNETDIDVIMLAGRYTLLEQGAATELLPACLEHDVAVVNVGVFNSGLLSKNRPAADATYNYKAAPRELLDRANQLADICLAHGATLPAAAVAFPYQHPAVTRVVLGMRTPEQVQQNLDLVAHVIAHVSSSGRALVGLIDWATSGEERRLYASPEARTEAIAALAALPREELLAEVRDRLRQ